MAEPRVLVDSNICIYLLEGRDRALLRRFGEEQMGAVVTSAIVYAEVMLGVVRAEREQAEELFRRVPPLPFDAKAARCYTEMPFRRGGYDRLIAAQAVSLSLALVTNNEGDFAGIPGLEVENWTRTA